MKTQISPSTHQYVINFLKLAEQRIEEIAASVNHVDPSQTIMALESLKVALKKFGQL